MTTAPNPIPPNIIWAPQPGSSQRFLSCPIFEVLFEGTRGCAKTDSLLMSFAQHVGKGYGEAWRGILFRHTYPALADIVAKSKKWFYRIFPQATFNNSTYTWTWPSGEQLLLRHMARPDDYYLYHGHEYPWIGWEELTNWSIPDCYEAMMSCCRSSHPTLPRMYRATTNPWGVGHSWVKRRFIDLAPPERAIRDNQGQLRVYIHGDLEENKILLRADPDYIKRLNAISNSNKRKAWRFGLWDILAGGMFSDLWNKQVHVIRPFHIPDDWYINRAFDWGSSKPFSVGWWAESNGEALPDGRSWPAGTLFRIAEWYGCERDEFGVGMNKGLNMLLSEIAAGVLEREEAMNLADRVDAGPGDIMATDHDGRTIGDKMAEFGVDWTPARKSKGTRVGGWETMRERMAASLKQPMESPGLFVFETCRDFIRTIPSLPRSEKNMDDIDSDAEDHCLHGDTLIITDKGKIPIREMVKKSGYVLTTEGWRKFVNCRLTRKQTPTVKLFFSNGYSLICTPDHKILNADGKWIEAVDACGIVCYNIGIHQNRKSILCILKLSAKRFRNLTATGFIFAGPISKGKAFDCIVKCGNFTMDQFRADIIFIIKMAIGRIIESKILKFWPQGIMHAITSMKDRLKFRGLRFPKLARRRRSGTDQRPVMNGIKSNIISIARMPFLRPKTIENVCSATPSIAGNLFLNSALTSANLRIDGLSDQITLQSAAHDAEKNFLQTSTGTHNTAVEVVALRQDEAADVYCLDVPGIGDFVIDGGVVVHNCADEARYRILQSGLIAAA